MGTISDKLTYLNTTKSQLKDMINYGLDDNNKITSSTTFRNYVGSIFNAFLEALRTPDTLFTNLPKKSGSGSIISLNDTANAPMRIELGASELTQDSTKGYNLVDTPETNTAITGSGLTYKREDDGTIKITGTTNRAWDYTLTTTYTFEAGKTYTFSVEDATEVFYILFNSANGGQLSATPSYPSKTITINETQTLPVKWSKGSGQSVNINVKIMVEEGSTKHNYEPYTGGIASPNPSYPQDIHTISGSNKVVVCGKNLFDFEQFKNNSSATITGSLNNFTYSGANKETFYTTDFIENINYHISGTWSTTYGNGRVRVAYTDGTYQTMFENYSSGSANGTINITTYSSKLIKQIEIITWTSGNFTFNNFQIEYGDTATTYTPYTSQEADIDLDTLEYCKIGTYEDKFIRTSGSNLFNENKTKDNYFYNSSGTTTTDNTNKFINMELPLSSKYTITFDKKTDGGGIISYVRICEYNGSTFIKRTQVSTTNTTITIDSNTTKVIASVDAGPNAYFTNLMINYGSTALPYEPYGTNEWYIKKNIGKVVLDGTENWSAYSEYNLTNTNLFVRWNALETHTGTTGNIKSNNFKTTTGFTLLTTTDENMIQTYSDKSLYIRIDNTLGSNLSNFKTWLSNNNTEIYYVLPSPTYTQITGTLAEQLENVYKNMLSQKGQTNISQINNDLAFNISASALEDL